MLSMWLRYNSCPTNPRKYRGEEGFSLQVISNMVCLLYTGARLLKVCNLPELSCSKEKNGFEDVCPAFFDFGKKLLLRLSVSSLTA